MAPVTRAQEQQDGEQKQDVKITLYWLEKSRAQRILWLLEELQLPYELKTFKRQNMLAPPELKEVHPLGKAPLIQISSPATDQNPIVLAESSNIIEYLLTHFGQRLIPTQYQAGKEGTVGGETEEWLRYRYLMHYCEGTLMPYLVTMLLMRALRTQSPFLLRPLTSTITSAVETKYLNPNLASNLTYLESLLNTNPSSGGDHAQFLCGEKLSGADVAMSFPLLAARGRAGLTSERYPLLAAYVDRLEEIPSYKRAVQKIVEVEGSYDAKL